MQYIGYGSLKDRAAAEIRSAIVRGDLEPGTAIKDVELAEKLGRKPIHVALAYVLAQPFPVIPLIGPRTVGELEDSLSALDIRLTPEQVRWLEG